ncbi:PQQ-binding-like beta-propeller repeat protein [Nocardiopsis sp. NPDC006198]|uniref:PQQ-binding-like beta-propeller repeat protein n=1 Tax=Nocardiopsis sp. NPDC006198 TaxID=3154472 RepID=UPI0033BB45AF
MSPVVDGPRRPHRPSHAAPPRWGTTVRRPSAAAALCLLLALAACGRPELADPADALPLDGDPAPAAAVEPDLLPGVLDAAAGRATPYSSEPRGTDTGFVGPVTPEGGGELHFVGTDADGRTRWTTERNPSCTGFTLTRTQGGDDLVVLLDSDAAPDRGLLAARTTAAALDPSTGRRVWGPTEVPGTWVGPGLVFAQVAHTVMSADTGPAAALSADTGEVVADESRGGAVLHEYQGTVVLHRDGALRAVDAGSGDELWHHADLPVPDTLGGEPGETSLTYGPRPTSGSAPWAVITWERGETTVFTVHDLRDGRALAEPLAGAPPVSVGDEHGRAAVAGTSARSGEPVIAGWDRASGSRAWTVGADPGERPVGIVSGYLYTSLGGENRVRSMADGALLGRGDWRIPVAGTAGGTAVAAVPGDGGADSYTVFPPHGADRERGGA